MLRLLSIATALVLALICVSSISLGQEVPTFVDMGASAGLTAEGQHHAVAIGDYDNDGWEDIYVGSKFAPNALYRNNGDMTFTDVAAEAGVADAVNAGIAAASSSRAACAASSSAAFFFSARSLARPSSSAALVAFSASSAASCKEDNGHQHHCATP